MEGSAGFIVRFRLANLCSEGFEAVQSWKFFSKMFIVVGFVGLEFEIFGGFGWVRSSVLLSKPGFKRV